MLLVIHDLKNEIAEVEYLARELTRKVESLGKILDKAETTTKVWILTYYENGYSDFLEVARTEKKIKKLLDIRLKRLPLAYRTNLEITEVELHV